MKKSYKNFCDKNFLGLLESIRLKNFSAKKRRFATFDFETDNNPKNPQVYSWGILKENYEFIYGISIKTFLDYLNELKINTIFYSQNGSKFDNYFLIPQLIKSGFKENYTWIDNIVDINYDEISTEEVEEEILKEKPKEKEIIFLNWLKKYLTFFINKINTTEKELKGDIKKELEILEKKDVFLNYEKDIFSLHKIVDKVIKENKFLKRRWLEENEFQLIIEGNYKNFEIKLLNKHKKLITIRDALLIFPGSLSKKGETLEEEFKNKNLLKKELESGYGIKEHYKNLEEFENDQNELKYLFYDCLILLVYLINVDFSFQRKHWKLTAASTAYNRWKYGFFTEKIVKDFLLKGKIEKKILKREDEMYRFKGEKKYVRLKKIKDKIFADFFFPKKQEYIQKNVLNRWYYGGLTNFNPKNQGLLLEKLIKLDITSSYPSVMKFNTLPYGWIEERDKAENDFKFFRIEAKTDLINKFGLPFLKVENQFKARPYQSKIQKGTFIYLTSVEINNFKKYYQGKTKIDVVYSVKSINGGFFFKEYIDYYFSLKEGAKNQAEKIIAKLMLNSLYGKFGTKRLREQRIYDDENFFLIKNETENEYYAPLATAITAHGRMKLVDLIGSNYEVFIGGDTDSVIIPQKFSLNLKKQGFIGNNLGEWKIELEDMKGIFRRKKQYFYLGKEKEKEKYSFAFASLNSNNMDMKKLSWVSFLVGKKIGGQNRPKRLPGGIWIENFVKEIPPIWSKNYQRTDDGLNLWFNNEEEFRGGYVKQLKERKEVLENYEWRN